MFCSTVTFYISFVSIYDVLYCHVSNAIFNINSNISEQVRTYKMNLHITNNIIVLHYYLHLLSIYLWKCMQSMTINKSTLRGISLVTHEIDIYVFLGKGQCTSNGNILDHERDV